MSITAPADKNLDALVAALGEVRVASGSPSYSEIATRIGALRAQAGRTHRPPRSTVYDCFRPGRRRLDMDLVRDILLALGLAPGEVTAWLGQHGLGRGPTAWSEVVDARLGAPAAPEELVGRGNVTARIRHALLSRPEAVVLVDGMPGVGKSALVRHVAARLFAEGQIDLVVHADVWGSAPLSRPAGPEAIRAATLRLLGGTPRTDADARGTVAAIEAQLDGRRLLLVLDDVTTPEHLLALTGAGGVRVLAASRHRLVLPPGAGAHRVHLEILPPAGSLDLLRRTVGAQRVDAEPDAARRIVAQVGGLPLALALTGRRIATATHWTLADHAETVARRHESARLDDDVRATFEITYTALSPPERRTLRLLAVQPCSGLSPEELAVLCDTSLDAALHDVEELESVHLTLPRDADRVSLHDLVRTFATRASEEEDSPSQRAGALHRLRALWVERSWALHHALVVGPVRHSSRRLQSWPTIDREQARAWLNRAAVDVVLLTDPATAPDPEQVVELSEALAWAMSNYTRWRAARVLHARARVAAREVGDETGELVARLSLAKISTWLAEWDEAVALAAGARRGLDRLGLADWAVEAAQVLAIVAAQTGDFEEAARQFTAMLEHFEALGEQTAATMTRDNLAIVLFRSGRVEEALAQHLKAVEDSHAIGDTASEARACANVADDLLELGRALEALEASRRARELGLECADERTVAYATTNAGSALVALGSPREAAAEHVDALRLARSLGDVQLEVSVRNNLALARLELDDLSEAEAEFRRALEIADRIDDPRELARAHEGLEACHLRSGAAALAPSPPHRATSEPVARTRPRG
ncbi:MAG: NB-ARC domain-containing protein [Cellulomonadaceae bacterium]